MPTEEEGVSGVSRDRVLENINYSLETGWLDFGGVYITPSSTCPHCDYVSAQGKVLEKKKLRTVLEKVTNIIG